MTCYLLKHDWTRDEINARLGHKPSSREIDKYINFLAIGRHKSKKKVYDSNIHMISNELEETKKREMLTAQRMERQKEELDELKQTIRLIKETIVKNHLR